MLDDGFPPGNNHSDDVAPEDKLLKPVQVPGQIGFVVEVKEAVGGRHAVIFTS